MKTRKRFKKEEEARLAPRWELASTISLIVEREQDLRKSIEASSSSARQHVETMETNVTRFEKAQQDAEKALYDECMVFNHNFRAAIDDQERHGLAALRHRKLARKAFEHALECLDEINNGEFNRPQTSTGEFELDRLVRFGEVKRVVSYPYPPGHFLHGAHYPTVKVETGPLHKFGFGLG